MANANRGRGQTPVALLVYNNGKRSMNEVAKMNADKGLSWLAFAIVFAVLNAAIMLRYQYDREGTVRINRWTGERQEWCGLANGRWAWVEDCFDAQNPH